MRKQQIIILGIVFGISLLGLIILQTSYFQTAYEVKKEQFFYSANRAMDDMVDYIRKQEEAGRLSENGNLTEVKNRGVEIDAPIYIDPKRPIAVKNDPSAVANSMLNLIDDDSEVKDVSEFVGSKFKEDNLATSISKLQQAMKERTGENYRFVPEGKEAPEGLPENLVVLQQPLDHIYMAATAIMSLVDAVDAIDQVKFSGVNASGWYVEDAKKAMESGDMIYAGKYSEPDYETLVNGECDLAVESTMILHTPKVQEMIEDLDIPVFVDYSSYESHPLGRTEWIKLYGAMLNKEDAADRFFEEQAQVIEKLKGFENTEKTVVYFYVNTDGSIVVRKSEDYIPSMIEIAGGRYAFKNLKNADSNAPSVKLTMEEFYAVDADYLIYNGTIDGQVKSISDLEAKSNLFSEFKAVKEGNVWYTGKNLYQATDTVGELIMDMHLMLTDGDPKEMTFLEKMK